MIGEAERLAVEAQLAPLRRPLGGRGDDLEPAHEHVVDRLRPGRGRVESDLPGERREEHGRAPVGEVLRLAVGQPEELDGVRKNVPWRGFPPAKADAAGGGAS